MAVVLPLALMIAALGVGAIPSGAAAQEVGDEAVAQAVEVEARVTARRLADGRTEFAVQLRRAGGEWGARVLPQRRFFPATVAVDRWLRSSPVALEEWIRTEVGVHEVRVMARRVADGRTEFGLRMRRPGDAWSGTRLPQRRFFPATVAVDRWLRSSPLSITPAGLSGEVAVADTPAGPEPGVDGDADPFIQVSVSRGRTCAVRHSGQVSCWGRNDLQEWLSTAALSDVEMIAISANDLNQFHSCVLHEDRTVSCWGLNYYGRLGQGPDDKAHYRPIKVPGIDDAVTVAVGLYHTCTSHADGGVSCWGYGENGQMGDGTRDHARSPKRVPGLRDVTAIAAGSFTTCAIHVDGSLSCWGWGSGLSPRKVSGLQDVSSVAIGPHRSCAVTAAGSVHCWPLDARLLAVRVPGVGEAVAVSVGDQTVCLVHRDGGVSCWGERNEAGQIGDGTTTPRSRPVRLAGLSGAAAVSTSSGSSGGEAHTCAVRAGGSVYCWGGNGFGQIGDGTRERRLTPTRADVPGGTGTDGAPTDPTPLLRVWTDRIVAAFEAEYPWLRLAWDHIRERSRVVEGAEFAGAVVTNCRVSGGAFTCHADEMLIGLDSMDVEVVVHELAHVYDLTTGLAPPRAWGAVQLYFTSTFEGCEQDPWGAGVELLADAMRYEIVPGDGTTYLDHKSPECPALPTELSDEAWEVLRAGLAGEVPAWYIENITDGAALWSQFLESLSPGALANLATEFGGLCTLRWATFPFNPNTLPPAGSDPFC